MANPRTPRALGGLDRARQQAETDDIDLQPVRRPLEVVPEVRPSALAAEHPAVAAPPATPAVDAADQAAAQPELSPVQRPAPATLDEAFEARRRMGEGGDIALASSTAVASTDRPALTVAVVTRRPKQTFTIQIAAELDRILRDEMVRRTAESRKRVTLADLITKAFSADRIPESPEQAEVFACRLPGIVATDATVTTTVRIDEGTHERLALLRARIKQVRSVVLMRDVYTALILDHLGQLPKRAQRQLGE